jgi:ABC-type Fe3+/spermidine/putrescine transport system ATPase subunit
VTHDQEVAMTLSNRLPIMRDGRIEQIGTLEDVYHDLANPFVADFIGDTNLLDGVASNGGDGDVTLSVRPESVRLARSGEFQLSPEELKIML